MSDEKQAPPAQAVLTQADLCAQIAKNLGSGWLVVGPDGSAFQADTPHQAANAASKHRSRMLFDPAKAAEFDGLIADVRRRNEESNAHLEALLGTLNCPTCGGSGHIEDAIARMGHEAQPAQAVPFLDCRTCAHFTRKSGGCMSVVQCVSGDRFVATRPHQYWEAAPLPNEQLP